MNRKPIVAIPSEPVTSETIKALTDKEIYMERSVDTNQKYISQYGGIPFVTQVAETQEQAEEIMEICDGLFLTGGDDVNPALYGEEKLECCGRFNDRRDKSDMLFLKAALKLGKPIMAICRGSQIVNVYYGGTLYQDIKTQFKTDITHPDYAREHFNTYGVDNSAHRIKIQKGSPLYMIVGDDETGINSLHHQGVKDLGKNLVVQASAPDGMVESFYLDSDEQYLRAYQWHPEFQDDNLVKDAIVTDFLSECLINRENKL